MKISDFLRNKTFQIAGGVILNYFKIKKRRNTLYFGEIPARYFVLCESKGFGNEMREVARDWMYLYFSTLVPQSFRKINPQDLLNGLIRKVWMNMGFLSDMKVSIEGNVISVETVGEGTTELIGRNSFQPGIYEGIFTSLYGRRMKLLRSSQTPERSGYAFEVTDEEFSLGGRQKDEYNHLNSMPKVRGLTLEDMLRSNVFYLRGQKLYFRGKVIYPIENTAIHLFSNRAIMLDKVPGISRDFFAGVLESGSSPDERLRLLKNLMQAMGWGMFSIARTGSAIKIRIANPPFGLQKEEDNWDFLARMLLGYAKTIDERYELERIARGYRLLSMGFSR